MTEREQLNAELVQLHKRINVIVKRLQQLDQVDKREYSKNLPSEMTPEAFMSIDFSKVTEKLYTTIDAWFWKEYEKRGLINRAGYNPATNQRVLSICMDKQQPLEEQQGILDFVPFLKPAPIEEILKRPRGIAKGTLIHYIDIFEHTLSEHACYFLVALADWSEIYLFATNRIHKTFPNMQEALAYIHQNLWYRNGDED